MRKKIKVHEGADLHINAIREAFERDQVDIVVNQMPTGKHPWCRVFVRDVDRLVATVASISGLTRVLHSGIEGVVLLHSRIGLDAEQIREELEVVLHPLELEDVYSITS